MPKPANQISFSELSSLAHCETKWWYRYQEMLKGDSSNALWLGRIVGDTVAAMWRGDDTVRWWNDYVTGNPEVSDEVWSKARWLVDRYRRHYESEMRTYKTIATELELTAKLPYSYVEVIGFIDQVIEDPNGNLWIVERKTMADWRRLDWIAVDPQLTIYAWLARENGYEVMGIAYDAIRTYQWKRDEHPDAESFQWLWLDRIPEQLDAAVKEIGNGANVREHLRTGKRAPLHNIGTLCGQCSYKDKCFEKLAFPTELEFTDD